MVDRRSYRWDKRLNDNLHHIVDNHVEIVIPFLIHSPKNWENENEGKEFKKAKKKSTVTEEDLRR